VLKEIVIAIQSYFNAHQFIQKHKLWKWIIVPGIIYCLLFMVSMYFFGKTANLFIEWVSEISGLQNWLNKMHDSFLGFFFALSGLFFWLIQVLLYFSLFKYFWLIVGSPIFAYLSEKTEAIVHGEEVLKFSFKLVLSDIMRGIGIALRNAVWQTVYMFSILLLTLIPVIGWATPLFALLIECYYYGFSMLDYGFERRNLTKSQSIFFIGRHKGLAIGNGLIFYLVHFIPFLGWVLAPAYAIIAATLSLHQVNISSEVKQ
jgi:CysZ protein